MKNILITYYHSNHHHFHNSSPEANKVMLGVFIFTNVIFGIMCIWALIKWLKWRDITRDSYWDTLTDNDNTFIQFFFPLAMVLIDSIVLLIFFGWLVSLTF